MGPALGVVISADSMMELARTILVLAALFVVVWKTRSHVRKSDLAPITLELAHHGGRLSTVANDIAHVQREQERRDGDLDKKLATIATHNELMDLVGKVGTQRVQLDEFRKEVSAMVERNDQAFGRLEERTEEALGEIKNRTLRMESILMEEGRRK